MRNMYGIDINHPAPLQGYPDEMVFFPGALPLAIILRTFGTKAIPDCVKTGNTGLKRCLYSSPETILPPPIPETLQTQPGTSLKCSTEVIHLKCAISGGI